VRSEVAWRPFSSLSSFPANLAARSHALLRIPSEWAVHHPYSYKRAGKQVILLSLVTHISAKPSKTSHSTEKSNESSNGTTKTIRQRSQKGCQIDKGRPHWRQKAKEISQGVILGLHLSSPQTSPSGHWNLLEGDEYNELVSFSTVAPSSNF
jgi:hypothetical protein